MGITLALLAMLCFASNIIIVRSAAARMSVDSGFTVMLAMNVLCIGAACAVQAALRDTPLVWQWRGAAWFVASGVIGIFLGRRMLLDTVVALGAARASVFHSSSPMFTLIGAWLIVGERLGPYELCLMTLVIVGLWITQLSSSAHQLAVKLPPAALRRGMLVGLFAVAGFGMGNALRGVAMRSWDEAIFGTLIATVSALLCHLASVRDWGKVGAALRGGDRRGLMLFAGSGVATAAGSMLTTSAMHYMEIAIATLITFTTPLVIFPVTVFVFRNRESLTWRSAGGAAMVLTGIVLLALR
jgi:drug/metabolite transporter (DMT)-like permease